MNVLLTTSAAPSQSPFSTTEKRPPIGLGFLIDVSLESRHTEHFTGSLAIAARDDRSVDVDEIPLLEELVDREGQAAAEPEQGAEQV